MPERADARAAAEQAQSATTPYKLSRGVLRYVECPICGSAERRGVCEYSNLILFDEGEVHPRSLYRYALCYSCGIVYATARPQAAALRRLYASFDENLGRVRHGSPPKPEPPPPDARPQRIEGAPTNPSPLLERLSPLEPRGRRVLEIRAKNARLLEPLRREFGAEVFALAAFDTHHLKLQARGIPTGHLDFGDFEIGFEGSFDVVVSNHMLTHTLHPGRYFSVLATRIPPGGHLYVYNENSDRRMFERGKNLIAEMKCFHFQNFDVPVFRRVLARFGFRVVEVDRGSGKSSTFGLLAVRDRDVRFEAAHRDEVKERLAMYKQWHDESLLTLPHQVKEMIGGKVTAAGERLRRRGRVREVDGELRPERRLEFAHGEGYRALRGEPSA